MFLAPLTARSKVREVLRGLVATRQVHTISLGHAPHFYVAGTLPEFAVAPTLYASSSMPASAYFMRSHDHEDDCRGLELPKPAFTAAPAPVAIAQRAGSPRSPYSRGAQACLQCQARGGAAPLQPARNALPRPQAGAIVLKQPPGAPFQRGHPCRGSTSFRLAASCRHTLDRQRDQRRQVKHNGTNGAHPGKAPATAHTPTAARLVRRMALPAHMAQNPPLLPGAATATRKVAKPAGKASPNGREQQSDAQRQCPSKDARPDARGSPQTRSGSRRKGRQQQAVRLYRTAQAGDEEARMSADESLLHAFLLSGRSLSPSMARQGRAKAPLPATWRATLAC